MEEALQLYLNKLKSDSQSSEKSFFEHKIKKLEKSKNKNLGQYLFYFDEGWRGGGVNILVYSADDNSKYITDIYEYGGCPDYGSENWEEENGVTKEFKNLAELFMFLSKIRYESPSNVGYFFSGVVTMAKRSKVPISCITVGSYLMVDLIKEYNNEKIIKIIKNNLGPKCSENPDCFCTSMRCCGSFPVSPYRQSYEENYLY